MLGDPKVRELCEATHHEWVEEYYGYKCETCGEFIPYSCEPWLDDDGSLTQHGADSSICSGCGHIDGYHPEWCMVGE